MTRRTGSAYRYRRCLQFRLRTLLVLLVLASLAMGWMHWHLESYREQRRAFEAISPLAM